MNHLSDKDLDRLSREAAEQYDVQQNTSGWDQLNRKLNKELPVQGPEKRRRFLLLLLFFAFLTGGGMIYSYLNSPDPNAEDQVKTTNSKNKIPQKVSSAISDPKKRSTDSNQESTDSNRDNRDNKTASTVTEKAQQPDQASEIIPELKKSSETTSPPVTATGIVKDKEVTAEITKQKRRPAQNVSGKKKTITAGNRSTNQKVTSQRNNPQNPVAQKERSIDDKKKVSTDNQKNNEDIVDEKKEAASVRKEEDVKADTVKIEPAKTEAQPSSTNTVAKKPKATVQNKYPFTIGLVAGPDLSNVNFRFNDKPGFNAGIRFSWQFAPRFSVNTGAVYTKKNYSALGSDYHPPKGYWTNYVTIDKVAGSCWMIDIPLEVRYDIHTGNASKWFVSSGLSTYLMNKEDYEYHYMNNGVYTVRRWINEKNSNYILSVANLSAGYEKMISKHLSIQAEPYLKVPLKGVGFGKMQMNSYGLNVSVRYGFSFTKKPVTTSP